MEKKLFSSIWPRLELNVVVNDHFVDLKSFGVKAGKEVNTLYLGFKDTPKTEHNARSKDDDVEEQLVVWMQSIFITPPDENASLYPPKKKIKGLPKPKRPTPTEVPTQPRVPTQFVDEDDEVETKSIPKVTESAGILHIYKKPKGVKDIFIRCLLSGCKGTQIRPGKDAISSYLFAKFSQAEMAVDVLRGSAYCGKKISCRAVAA